MFFKFTEKDGTTFGGYKWPLPVKNEDGTWTPGKWTKKITGTLIPCENGYHITDKNHLLDWIDEELYEVEYKYKIVQSDNKDKYVARQARLIRRIEAWNEKSARLFAVWCARNALALVDDPDPRSVNAVDVAEKFANGEATEEELAAARDAARDAARAAAWAAARDAAWDAAWAAARDAAWDAARAAQSEYLYAVISK